MKRFLNPVPRQNPKVHLVCLPHAGATAAAYRSWGAGFPNEIEVWAVQLPGKGWRVKEQPISDLKRMADRVVEAVLDEVPEPFAFFGHSMGAWLGLEVVRRLESVGIRPHSLLVSGRQGPELGNTQPPLRHLDDVAFVREVQIRYGGIPQEILREPELLELLLPAVRADIVALETYEHDPGPKLSCPLTALGGHRDSNVPVEHLRPWGFETTGPFQVVTFPGGHFYFADNPAPLFRTIVSQLNQAGDLPSVQRRRCG